MNRKRNQKKPLIEISLKWKVVIIFGCVFFTIHGILSGLAIYTLQKQYDRQRLDTLERHKKTVDLLISQSARLLLQIGETIPLFSERFDKSSNDRIIATLNNYWSTFQLTWGLESIQYYSASNSLIKDWGAKKGVAIRQINNIKMTEIPRSFIECNATCIQYVGVPVIGQDGTDSTLIIGKNLADFILDFNKITHADIGLLIKDNITNTHTSYWGRRVAGISNAELSTQVLQATKNNEYKNLAQGIVINLGNRVFEVHSITLGDADNKNLDFVVIDDVTDTYKGKSNNLVNYILSGSASLIFGMLLLFSLLRIPMQRLTKITNTLPFLAEGKYKDVRKQLARPINYRTARDEIDALEQTILHVTDKLEQLQNEITTRTRILIHQRQMLEKERNFIQELLDTAPLIILTQDTSGKIITINRFGKNFLPISNSVFLSARFVFDEMFLSNLPDDEDSRNELCNLRSGKKHKVQFDTSLNSIEPHSRHITWHHTRLEGIHPKSPAVLSIGLDITDRKIAEERLIWLADHDPLTHLYNRRRFQQEFDNILKISLRNGSTGALLYFDLDQFKYVNDTCGHKVGDSLLQLIADKLKQVTRSTDILARLGGDEFALAIPSINAEHAGQLADKIFNSLQTIDFKVEGQPFKITVSIGIAMFPEHGQNIQDLLANADLAMYQAKEAGRGRIHFYEPGTDFQNKIKTQVYWKDQIEQCFRDDRFVLYFQPILDIGNQSISHYECLLRMIDTEGGVIAPGQFIPVAEQLGLINLIDRMVVGKAIQRHKSLRSEGISITLSINLSGQALNDIELQEDIKKVLSDPDVDPKSIIFEITETIAVSNFSSAQRMMNEIKSLGCSFAIDDFGVGFSSFYYLMHLPVDFVKIDGSFIKSLNTSKEDKVLVRALAEIAQGLGKKTIAEFVESHEILEVLDEFGVHYAQGYYIGKPARTIPVTTIENA